MISKKIDLELTEIEMKIEKAKSNRNLYAIATGCWVLISVINGFMISIFPANKFYVTSFKVDIIVTVILSLCRYLEQNKLDELRTKKRGYKKGNSKKLTK